MSHSTRTRRVEAMVTSFVSLCPQAVCTPEGQGLQRMHCPLESSSKPVSHSQMQLVFKTVPAVTHDASTGFPLQSLHRASCRSEHGVAVYVPTAHSVQGMQREPVKKSLSVHCSAARTASFSCDRVAAAAGSRARLGCAAGKASCRAKRIVTIKPAVGRRGRRCNIL